jgi:pyridoxamine 5'-phosphate oxidase
VAEPYWDRLVDWLPGNDDPERPRITLSTATPDARTVLLSEFDEQGFYVHTDARSRKVAQLADDPRVALTFLWPDFSRQLVVLGTAERAPADEQDRVYRKRSPYLKQLAWQNSPEFAQLPHEQRQALWASFADDEHLRHPPETWTGFLVRPHRLTFWESDATTASRRTEYTLVDGVWQQAYLPG